MAREIQGILFPQLAHNPARNKRPQPRRNRANPLFKSRAKRVMMEELLSRTLLLPPAPRAILRDYFQFRTPTAELARRHNLTPRKMRRRIARWKEMLRDPDFLLAARFGPQLHGPQVAMASAYWLEGKSLRQIAAELNSTLHAVRTLLAETRLQLVRASAAALLRAG